MTTQTRMVFQRMMKRMTVSHYSQNDTAAAADDYEEAVDSFLLVHCSQYHSLQLIVVVVDVQMSWRQMTFHLLLVVVVLCVMECCTLDCC